mmetsp:Transcript_6451/g.11353  ORF Transcript_6451/g.11353 Transcript_6451/m.11353 type:complete len:89 (+) Transcript_6451:2259-2525(+)
MMMMAVEQLTARERARGGCPLPPAEQKDGTIWRAERWKVLHKTELVMEERSKSKMAMADTIEHIAWQQTIVAFFFCPCWTLVANCSSI